MRHRRIFRAQGGKCYYCDVELVSSGESKNDPRERTLDHVIPRFWGGLTIPENLVYACKKCNMAKGHKYRPSLESWIIDDRLGVV